MDIFDSFTITEQYGNSFFWICNQSSNDSVSVTQSSFGIGKLDYVAYMTSKVQGHQVVPNFDQITVTNVTTTAFVWTSDDDDTLGFTDGINGDD